MFVPNLLHQLNIEPDYDALKLQAFEWSDGDARATKPPIMEDLVNQVKASFLNEYFDTSSPYVYWKVQHGPHEMERWHQDGSMVDINLTINLQPNGRLTRMWCYPHEMESLEDTDVGDAVFFSGATTHSEPLVREWRLAILLRLKRIRHAQSMDCNEFLTMLSERFSGVERLGSTLLPPTSKTDL